MAVTVRELSFRVQSGNPVEICIVFPEISVFLLKQHQLMASCRLEMKLLVLLIIIVYFKNYTLLFTECIYSTTNFSFASCRSVMEIGTGGGRVICIIYFYLELVKNLVFF